MTLGYVVRTSTRDIHKSELVKIIIMKCSNTHSHTCRSKFYHAILMSYSSNHSITKEKSKRYLVNTKLLNSINADKKVCGSILGRQVKDCKQITCYMSSGL